MWGIARVTLGKSSEVPSNLLKPSQKNFECLFEVFGSPQVPSWFRGFPERNLFFRASEIRSKSSCI